MPSKNSLFYTVQQCFTNAAHLVTAGAWFSLTAGVPYKCL